MPAGCASSCRPRAARRRRVARILLREAAAHQPGGVCRDARVAAGCPHRWRPRRGGAHRRAGHKSASGPRADTVGANRPETTSTTLGRRLRRATDDHQRDSPTGPALSLRGNSPQDHDHSECSVAAPQRLVAGDGPPLGVLGTAHRRACPQTPAPSSRGRWSPRIITALRAVSMAGGRRGGSVRAGADSFTNAMQPRAMP